MGLELGFEDLYFNISLVVLVHTGFKYSLRNTVLMGLCFILLLETLRDTYFSVSQLGWHELTGMLDNNEICVHDPSQFSHYILPSSCPSGKCSLIILAWGNM